MAGVAASNAIVLMPLTEEDGGDGGDGGGNGGGGGGGDGSGGGPGSGDRRPAPVIVAARPTEKRLIFFLLVWLRVRPWSDP